LHTIPQTPQFVSEVVWTGLPEQQRAVSSPGCHWVPSGNAADAPQTPALHVGTPWQASSAAAHGVPSDFACGAQTPAVQVGVSWQASLVPHAVPSGCAVQGPDGASGASGVSGPSSGVASGAAAPSMQKPASHADGVTVSNATSHVHAEIDAADAANAADAKSHSTPIRTPAHRTANWLPR
jgi:hypothetical protein